MAANDPLTSPPAAKSTDGTPTFPQSPSRDHPPFRRQRTISSSCRFDEDFDLIERIGQGTFGHVMKVAHRLDGQIYAVKRLRMPNPPSIGSPHDECASDLRNKLLREVATLSRLHHVNIVRYYQAWIEDRASHELSFSEDEDRSEEGHQEAFDFFGSDSASGSAGHAEDCEPCSNLAQANCIECGCAYLPWNLRIANQSVFLPEDGQLCTECFSQRLSSTGLRSLCQLVGFECMAEQSMTHKCLFIQMEYCSLTLRDLIGIGQHHLPQSSVLPLFEQLVCGLEYVHSQGIIHRDVKPANVFLTGSSGEAVHLSSLDANQLGNLTVKLGDFGLARFKDAPGSSGGMWRRKSSLWPTSPTSCDPDESSLSTDIGTLLYLPPDQLLHWDDKVDIYGLGIVLFEMLCPFKTGMERLIRMKLLRQARPEFPPTFEASCFEFVVLIRRLLAFEASKRPTARETLNDVQTLTKSTLKRSGSSPMELCKLGSAAAPSSPPDQKHTRPNLSTGISADRTKPAQADRTKPAQADRTKPAQANLGSHRLRRQFSSLSDKLTAIASPPDTKLI